MGASGNVHTDGLVCRNERNTEERIQEWRFDETPDVAWIRLVGHAPCLPHYIVSVYAKKEYLNKEQPRRRFSPPCRDISGRCGRELQTPPAGFTGTSLIFGFGASFGSHLLLSLSRSPCDL